MWFLAGTRARIYNSSPLLWGLTRGRCSLLGKVVFLDAKLLIL
jgi:hypothetical protein